MKKSQIANEFLIMVGISILVLLIFMTIQADDFKYLGITKQTRTVNDLGKSIQREIFIASEVKDGYTRTFNIPTLVEGYNYSINNTNNEIIMYSMPRKIEHNFLIPNIIGNLTKGINIIRKTGGLIYVN